MTSLSACGGGESGSPFSASSVFSFASALSGSFVSDWAPFESDALARRTSNVRYTIQDFLWSFGGGGPTYDSYSLSHANVEYAHAAGLTGAGQTIAIIDSGFLSGHDEFTGKNVTEVTGFGALPVDDHGTGVASVAAGVSDAGDLIGVAPGADLHLGSINSLAEMAAATAQAQAIDAIVQNNSWGYNIDVSSSNYNSVFGGTDGNSYLTALKDFAANGIVVFASSNDATTTNAELMAALPVLVPELEASWIATVNAVPLFTGDEITSAERISSACLEAAAWCMAADGTSYTATSTGVSDYALSTGTSFAAPQVSGAVALLAEAFPTLSAQEIRARILASANNGFYGHTGYIEFAPGVDHGFNEEFGHGFLDLRAALLPIGGAYVPTTSGNMELSQPLVLSGGMVGNALTTRLANYDLMIVDGLGGGFSTPANALAADALPQSNPLQEIGELLSADLNSSKADPFHPTSTFSSFVSGQEMNLEVGDNAFAVMLPQQNSSDASYGVALAHRFDLANSKLSLGVSATHEDGGFVGMKSILPEGNLKADHAAATFDWEMPLLGKQELHLSGQLGVAVPDGAVPTMSMDTVSFNSLKVTYGARDVFGSGDRLSLGLALPQAVQSGSVGVVMPVTLGVSGASFATQDLSLAPADRQLDLTIGYGVPLSKSSELMLSATRSLNEGHIGGLYNTVASVGFRFDF